MTRKETLNYMEDRKNKYANSKTGTITKREKDGTLHEALSKR